jgi:hypothetical protein
LDDSVPASSSPRIDAYDFHERKLRPRSDESCPSRDRMRDDCGIALSQVRGRSPSRASFALTHTSSVSDPVRIGLGVLAASWFYPVLLLAFLVLRSEIRIDAPLVAFLVYRGVPALIMLAAVITGNWAIVVAAFATAAVTALAVEVMRRRWPERWNKLGETSS